MGRGRPPGVEWPSLFVQRKPIARGLWQYEKKKHERQPGATPRNGQRRSARRLPGGGGRRREGIRERAPHSERGAAHRLAEVRVVLVAIDALDHDGLPVEQQAVPAPDMHATWPCDRQ